MALRTKIQPFSRKQDINIQMHIKADLNVWNSTMGMLTKQLWVRLTQQFFFSSSDVSATTCFDHFDHHQAIVALD
jgi:hypothetical protein